MPGFEWIELAMSSNHRCRSLVCAFTRDGEAIVAFCLCWSVAIPALSDRNANSYSVR